MPAVLNGVPSLTLIALGLAVVFFVMSIPKEQKDMRFLSLSALAYALVPLWPLIYG
ncbi:MAG: hypothetical protein QM770_05210 [Tepidisphaeraceae bacterium]